MRATETDASGRPPLTPEQERKIEEAVNEVIRPLKEVSRKCDIALSELHLAIHDCRMAMDHSLRINAALRARVGGAE